MTLAFPGVDKIGGDDQFIKGFEKCWKEYVNPLYLKFQTLELKFSDLQNQLMLKDSEAEEQWQDILKPAGYRISSLGRVYSTKTNKFIGGYISSSGNYATVTFNISNGKTLIRKIHRLVAQAFIPNTDNLPQVNHKDGNKLNNRVENLEWCSSSANVKHAMANGLNTGFGKRRGSESTVSKLTEDDVREIRRLWAEGKATKSELSRKYQVTWPTIYCAIERRTWKHVI